MYLESSEGSATRDRSIERQKLGSVMVVIINPDDERPVYMNPPELASTEAHILEADIDIPTLKLSPQLSVP